MQSRRLTTIAILVAVAMLFARAAGAGAQLKVNLLVGNDSIMMYAGTTDGIKVGDKFTIMRGDRMVGTCEVTKVESTYSVAKIVEKYEDIREMDTLTGGVQQAVKPKAAGEEKSKPKATKEEPKKEEKKESAKKEPAKKETAKKETPKKEEKKAAAPKKDEAAAKDTKKDDKKADAKKDDKKAEPAKAAAAKTKAPYNYTAFPSANGPTGLFQAPTAEIADNRKGAISFFRTTWSGSASGAGTGTATQTYSYAMGTSVSRTDLAVAYGIDDRFELSFAQSHVKGSSVKWLIDYVNNEAYSRSITLKQTTIGLKFNPRKRVFLQPTTTKKFQTAVGVERVSYNQGVPDNTIYYGAVTMPTKKFKVHATLYDVTGKGVGGQHWGTTGGIELPLTNKMSFISDADTFQGVENYSFGLRYFINESAMASLGYINVTDDPATMLNLGYKF